MLAHKKNGPAQAQSAKKGKNAGLEQWDADLRKQLEAKKKSAVSEPKLSKEDKVLIDAQLLKESEIRRRVSQAQLNLSRGLALVRALVEADVAQFQRHIAPIATQLLEGVLPRAITLVGPVAFDTYLVRRLAFLIRQ